MQRPHLPLDQIGLAGDEPVAPRAGTQTTQQPGQIGREEILTTLIQRRSVLQTGVAGLTGLAAAGLRPARAQEGKKLRIALSNSYIGNKWRIEMENASRRALQMEP